MVQAVLTLMATGSRSVATNWRTAPLTPIVPARCLPALEVELLPDPARAKGAVVLREDAGPERSSPVL